ncbi:hypothetical protein IQ22_04751 [Pseudomonas duriflava]|uniref:Uncharacterized protein n=1 Tax=Pseudomonas duriflava TaxID=459528 RepID=A0A562PIF6_9PSED|nr:hypothetical protein [Pseudomonas duriflava]TWI44158.1 hypothetical protein IQ22_04751 [Pseudomonas duriflava]
MDIFDQIEAVGLHVISGHRRLQGALQAGHAAMAKTSDGTVYQISLQNGAVRVQKLSTTGEGVPEILVAPVVPGTLH